MEKHPSTVMSTVIREAISMVFTICLYMGAFLGAHMLYYHQIGIPQRWMALLGLCMGGLHMGCNPHALNWPGRSLFSRAGRFLYWLIAFGIAYGILIHLVIAGICWLFSLSMLPLWLPYGAGALIGAYFAYTD